MARAKKKGASGSGEFSLFDDSDSTDGDSEEDLPRDEVGRAKIKTQYVDLLGIRVNKLAGRILNRERINKTLEGVYFVCVRCRKVCHNLDEGLVEDEGNVKNVCVPCSKQAAEAPARPAPRKAPSAKTVAAKAARAATATKAAATAKAAPAAAKKKAPAKPARSAAPKRPSTKS
jgi:hypothetical protein